MQWQVLENIKNGTHHLNLVNRESNFWKNQLAFRDYLRSHDQMAAAYVVLKRQIKADYARTQELDLDAKTEFVHKMLALAEKERGDTSRSGEDI